MQALGEVPELGQPFAQFAEHPGELRPRVFADLRVAGEPRLQVKRDRYEPLLRPVVQITLDTAACPVGRLDDSRARRPYLGQLRLDQRALSQRVLGLVTCRDVEDRSVQPAPAVVGLLEPAALEHPADAAVAADDPVLDRERPPGLDAVDHRSLDVLAVLGMDHARKRALRAGDEVVRGVTGDPLDLVADPLHRPVRVARAAVHGAGDIRDERAHQRVAGAQASRP